MESHRVNSIIYQVSGRSPPLYCMYTYINHSVGTPKQKQTSINSYYTVFLDKEFQMTVQ